MAAMTTRENNAGLIGRFQSSSLSLATKLLAIIVLAVLIPQLVAGGINYAVARGQTLNQRGSDVVARQAINTSSVLANYLTNHLSALESISLNDSFENYLVERNAEYGSLNEQGIQAQLDQLDAAWRAGDFDDSIIQQAITPNAAINPLNQNLASYQAYFPALTELFVTDRFGGTAGLVDLTSDYYQADEGWWEAAFANGNGQIYISPPEYDESSNTNALLIALPIRNDDGEIVGILRGTLSVDPMIAELAATDVGTSGGATLFTGDGGVLLTNTGVGDGSISADLNTTMMDDQIGYVFADNEQGLPAIIGHVRMGSEAVGGASSDYINAEISDAILNLDWHVMVQQTRASALSGTIAATLLPIILSLAAAALGVVIAYLLIRAETRQAEEMIPVFASIEKGDLSARVPVLTGDELGVMAGSFNRMLDNTAGLMQSQEERDRIQKSIMRLLDEVSQVAEGDLTAEAEVTEDMTGAIADSFNFMIEQLRDIIVNVQDATVQVSSSANEIQTTAEHLAMGSESQAMQIVDTSAAIDEMSLSIQQVSENATLSATVSDQARTNAQLGAEAVRDTIQGMTRVRSQMQDTTKRIKRLEESSQQIGDIVELIDDIADRTSILALNATIQAEMAGESGRSFAVVAEEVDRLAVRATKATQQIALMIRNVQSEMNELVAAMDMTNAEVISGTSLAEEAGQRLNEIESVSERLAELISQISLASKQQARGSETISRAMSDIADVTQQTAAGTKQATASIGNLAYLADRLRASVSTFKLPNDYAMATD